MLVPGLMAAPLLWSGVHPVVAYNILLLSSFVLSGVTMFLLVRALTGRVDAGLIAGTLFALYPYRFEHYSHLELLMTMWMPLALWGLHRTLSSGRLRDGLATGLAFALQTLSSLYYGCFLAVYMAALGGALWLGRGRPRRPLPALAAGALLAALLIAPVASQYVASRPMMGTRGEGTIQFYSARGDDYLQPHFRLRLYQRWSEGGRPERQLFPRLLPVLLAAVALWPPLSVTRIAYVLAFLVAMDGSFGFNGPTFTSLHAALSPFRGLRVPARFSLLAGMTLTILAGYGAARLLERWPRRRVGLAAVLLTLAIVEAYARLPLQRVWDAPPQIYSSINGREPPVVLAEFPMPRDVYQSHLDTRYLYFAIFHWQILVNGGSGFFPALVLRVACPGTRLPERGIADLSTVARSPVLDDARRVHQPCAVRVYGRLAGRTTRSGTSCRSTLGGQRVPSLPPAMIAFYISKHEFDYDWRDIEIIAALTASRPGVRSAVRTSTPS